MGLYIPDMRVEFSKKKHVAVNAQNKVCFKCSLGMVLYSCHAFWHSPSAMSWIHGNLVQVIQGITQATTLSSLLHPVI